MSTRSMVADKSLGFLLRTKRFELGARKPLHLGVCLFWGEVVQLDTKVLRRMGAW